MPVAPAIHVIPGSAHPLDVAAGWPADRPLLMLCSAGSHPRWARWSILATPSAVLRVDTTGSTIIGEPPAGRSWPTLTDDPRRDLAACLRATSRRSVSGGPPFVGGWIGYLSYDLGARLEPAAAGGAALDDRGWPLIELAWCGDALVHDGVTGRWWTIGRVPSVASIRNGPIDAAGGEGPDPAVFESSLPRDDYVRAATRVVEYIHAGDVFQVNLAQRLTTTWRGDPRAMARRTLRSSGAWYGAFLELTGDRRLVSLSPELFLEIDPASRGVITRPIKGTRPGRIDREELSRSAKDAAELHMIVDLMRNDLGRVCRFGSISVPHARRVESYPTVHHGVGEIHGVLRDDVDVATLLDATFPGGSITGAPKIRAMQIIDELEPVRRGPYCGAIGIFGDDGWIRLNIAIRTMMLSRPDAPARKTERRPGGPPGSLEWTLDYGVGAGIVADSTPAHEYRECLDKAAVLRGVL